MAEPYTKIGASITAVLMKLFGKTGKTFAAIQRRAGLPPRARVLDVGGGAGRIAARFADAGHAATILDPSPNMLALARHSRLTKWVGTADHIPFKAGTFDLVYAVDAWHHFSEGVKPEQVGAHYLRCAREFLRVAKPTGAVVIVDVNPDRWFGRLARFLERKRGCRFFTPSELAALFRKLGAHVQVREKGSMYMLVARK